MEDYNCLADHDIGRVASHFNISHRTLRFYEAEGLLSPRKKGTFRIYSTYDRTRIEFILTARRFGFTVSGIFKLLDRQDKHQSLQIADVLTREDMEDRVELLVSRRDGIDRSIDDLRDALQRKAQASEPAAAAP